MSETDHNRLTRSGAQGLSTDHALDLFDAALRSPYARLVPTKLDYDVLRDLVAAGELPPIYRNLVQAPPRRAARSTPATSLPDRLARLSGERRLDLVLDLVRAQAAAVLGHTDAGRLGTHQTFKDLGFDSLTAVELRNRLAAATDVRLPATLVFDHPTPSALARRLLAELVPDSPTQHEETDLIATMDAETLVARALGERE